MTLGSRKAIPWPMPAGMAATAQAAARPIMKIKKARPVGHLRRAAGFFENWTAIADHDHEDDPGEEDTRRSPRRSRSPGRRPRRSPRAARCGT